MKFKCIEWDVLDSVEGLLIASFPPTTRTIKFEKSFSTNVKSFHRLYFPHHTFVVRYYRVADHWALDHPSLLFHEENRDEVFLPYIPNCKDCKVCLGEEFDHTLDTKEQILEGTMKQVLDFFWGNKFNSSWFYALEKYYMKWAGSLEFNADDYFQLDNEVKGFLDKLPSYYHKEPLISAGHYRDFVDEDMPGIREMPWEG